MVSSRKGNLLIISGPSGAGKGTLVARLVERIPDVWVSVSATTRDPRPGEIDSVHYYFMDEGHFQDLVKADGFLEWAEVHGHHYGTLRSSVEKAIAAGKQVILEIDVQGAFQVQQSMPDAHLIFIEPPSLEELERRLRARGTEEEDVVLQRMATAKVELARKMEYDVRVINDDLERATKELVSLVNTFAEDTGGTANL